MAPASAIPSYLRQQVRNGAMNFVHSVVRATCIGLVVTFATSAFGETGRELFDKLASLDARRLLEMQSAPPEKVMGVILSGANDSVQTELEVLLKKQALEGDSESAFYWGLRNYSLCKRASDDSTGPGRLFVEALCSNSVKGFTIASQAGVPAATWNLATMYEAGLWFTQSRLAAAEWFSRAGHQYVSKGDRERALAALERAEEIDKAIPDVKRLRAVLFPPSRARVK